MLKLKTTALKISFVPPMESRIHNLLTEHPKRSHFFSSVSVLFFQAVDFRCQIEFHKQGLHDIRENCILADYNRVSMHFNSTSQGLIEGDSLLSALSQVSIDSSRLELLRKKKNKSRIKSTQWLLTGS